MWNNFENDKKSLKTQYSDILWDVNSGLTPEKLREKCLNIEKDLSDCSASIVKSKMMEFIFDNAQLSLNPQDWFQAKINHDSIIISLRDEKINYYDAISHENILKDTMPMEKHNAVTCIFDFGHVAPDWDNIINLGLTGLIKRLELESSRSELTRNQKDFYNSSLRVYKALKRYIIRLSDAAASAEENREKMSLVAKSLKNISSAAPKNMLEVLQLIYIFYYVQTWVEGEGIRSLGRLDNLCYRFYENDLKCGTFSEEQLRELIDYFYYELFAVGATANSPFCICGSNPDGSAFINKLSYVLIEEYIKCNIDDPKIHIRYNKNLPNDFTELVLKSIRGGNNSIVFVNDEIIINALTKIGTEKSDAVNYAPIGCYEPSVCGKEISCSSAGRINLLKAIEYTMSNGIEMMTGERVFDTAETPKNFEEFYSQVKDKIRSFADGAINIINEYEHHFMKINPSPILSGTMTECVKRGKDVYEGGAKYNNTSIYVFGLADIVDSIIAVKNLVFKENAAGYNELCDIIKNNWANNEMLNLKCRNSYPKYGNNEHESDVIACEITNLIADSINNRQNSRGGVYRCGLFSIDMYHYFGEQTGATPNGRKHGEWFAKNLSPTIGNDKKGLTSLINSVTKIDFTNIPDGAVLDLMLHSSAVSGEEGLCAMNGILKTYMNRGGMAVQFNVINPDQLKDAQNNPELYPNLQVRLCGWNVYFTNLSKGEQNAFIKAAEHSAN